MKTIDRGLKVVIVMLSIILIAASVSSAIIPLDNPEELLGSGSTQDVAEWFADIKNQISEQHNERDLDAFSSDYTSEHEKLSMLYTFDRPVVDQIEIGATEYDRIIMPGAHCGGRPGEPFLPTKAAQILLPPGTSTGDIIITLGPKIVIGREFSILPCAQPVSLDGEEPGVPISDEAIYTSDKEFPGKLFSKGDTYDSRGYAYQLVMLHPVQYNPVTGELYYYKSMHVSLELIEDREVSSLFRGLDKDKREIMQKVDNPQIADRYEGIHADPIPLLEYAMVIVTTDELETAFLPLKEAHDAEGLPTVIKAVEDIYSEYPGVDEPEQVRNFIRDAYTKWGIEYALIGGDHDIIPARKLYMGSQFIEEPGDLYLGCLQGSFNADGDELWGEPEDGYDFNPSGEVDLVAEVYVGRACVGNATEVGYFVNKTIAYMTESDEYLNNVVLAGEILDDDPYIWGGDYLDQLIDGYDSGGYVTVGIPTGEFGYNITQMYDKDWGDDPGTPQYDGWPESEIKGHINNGTHIINHAGHAGLTVNMKLQHNEECGIPWICRDLDYIINTKYCFIYSWGCYSGWFDWPEGSGGDVEHDAIAEYFTVKIPHGAFAGIWNARAGYYSGQSSGPSHYFMREFWDAVFGEQKMAIGKANQDSKEDNIWRLQHGGTFRNLLYGLNLFGDPAVSFKYPWRGDHNLGIKSLQVEPDHVGFGRTVYANATIANYGQDDEENVLVSLRINDEEVKNVTIPLLEYHETRQISIPWITPEVAGEYEVAINVSIPGISDYSYDDNEVSSIVIVGIFNKNTGLLYDTIQQAIDDEYTLDEHTIFVPKGVYREYILITKSITIEGEDIDRTFLTDGIRSKFKLDSVIRIEGMNFVTITGFTISGKSYGLYLSSSSYTIIRECTVTGSRRAGIYLQSATANIISHCDIRKNTLGIQIASDSTNNHIIENDIIDNTQGVVLTIGSFENDVFYNNFNNTQNAFDAGTENQWDNGYQIGIRLSGGNWWADYNGTDEFSGPDQNISGSDDIGDTPYAIPGGINQDRYPLMNPWTGPIPLTIYVDDDNEGGPWHGTLEHPFQHISGALPIMERGDTIYVFNGTYKEHFIIDESIKLVGEHKDHTVIDGERQNDTVTISADDVTITGFTIINSTRGIATGGIRLCANKTIIHNTTLNQNGIGVILDYANDNIIKDTTFIWNQWGGLSVNSSSNNSIQNCVFQNTGYAVKLMQSSNNSISENDFTNCYVGIGMEHDTHRNKVSDNTITSSEDYGIYILNSDKNNITNNDIGTGSYIGIYLEGSCLNIISENQLGPDLLLAGIGLDFHSDNNGIINNTIFDNDYFGIGMGIATSNILRDNSITGHGDAGLYLMNSNNHIIGNTLQINKYGIYLEHGTCFTMISQNNISYNRQYGIILRSHNRYNTIIQNTLYFNRFMDIYLEESDENTISDNIIRADFTAIWLQYYSDLNLIMNNNISSRSEYGIFISDGYENTILDNDIWATTWNVFGVYLTYSGNNTIQGNTFSMNNYGGIILEYSNNNLIVENTIRDTCMYGIGFFDSYDNQIYRNTFMRNSPNAYDFCENSWNASYPICGNYWDDFVWESAYDDFYGPSQNISGSDNIIDLGEPHGGLNPYSIPGEVTYDFYPFMSPLGPLTVNANGPYVGVVDIPIQFTGSATGGNPPYTWHWDFGDGGTSELRNPLYTYSTIGDNTVTLTVYDYAGNDASDITNAEIKEIRANANGPYIGVINESIQFTGSVIGGISPYEWSWDFGDGTTSELKDPIHTYTRTDVYTVTLTVVDSLGKTDTDPTNATIRGELEADAGGPYESVVGFPVEFNGSATGGIPPYQWSWDFGDGNTSDLRNPEHSYSTEGNYTAILTVTDDRNISANDTALVTIASIPSSVWVDDDFNETTPGWGVEYFDSIQDGIDAVHPNGTVYVNNGYYEENLDINKSISLIGEDRYFTVIDGGGNNFVLFISVDMVNISGFTIMNCGWEMWDAAIYVWSDHNNISRNIIAANLCGIWLQHSVNTTIIENEFVNNQHGITLWESSYNIITRNTISQNGAGVNIYEGYNNTISDNTMTYNEYGFQVDNAHYNKIENNLISANFDQTAFSTGISFVSASNNTISNNNITRNYQGLILEASSHNNISGNTISNNYDIAFYLWWSSNHNKIYHNNFINQTLHIYDESDNIWDDGFPSGGNYWDDYEELYPDAHEIGDSGIWDTPYEVPSFLGLYDWYPLMEPYQMV